MIEVCHLNTYCKVQYQRELSPQFDVQSGLKQYDSMTPILFNLALEKVITDTSVRHELMLNRKIVMLAYADDIVILDDTKDNIVRAIAELINN